MKDVRRILHIGAPKCGSSALQASLSRKPNLKDGTGRKYRYVASRSGGQMLTGRGVKLTGRGVTLASRLSPYGYVSWPSVTSFDTEEAFWAMVGKATDTARRGGYSPILSNEGLIAHAAGFSEHVTPKSDLRTEVIAFVRPPLEWLNAAYWQWGIWGGMNFNNWLARPATAYRLGAQIEAWSRVPGVTLTVRSAKQDVVAAFAEILDLNLAGGTISNSSSPPALIGFLLRNRRFRPTAHTSAVEFVFQRWCRVDNPARLWAFKPRQVQQIRQAIDVDVEKLMQAINPSDAKALLQDPRWRRTAPYHDQLSEPMQALDDREALAGLHAALLAGLQDCCAAAGTACPDIGSLPAIDKPIEDWDIVVAQAMDALIGADASQRQNHKRFRFWGDR